MEKIRVATLQYFIRPVRSFSEFHAQVEGLVDTAADYRCQLVVFPEYFTTQLLTLADIRRPIREQIRDLARQLPHFMEVMSALARKHGIYLVAGTIPVLTESQEVKNRCHVFGPDGAHGVQGKLHMTRFEKEEWDVTPEDDLAIFETRFGRIAVAICYDVEFPEIARAAARQGVDILLVPSCTDDRQGYLRVRFCGHARAIENQIYVVQSSTVGSLPSVPAVFLNYGQACILTPSDFSFARDGVLAEGQPNLETMVIGELDLTSIRKSRENGTVLPLLDSARTSQLTLHPQIRRL